MKVIFLDIDGVVNHSATKHNVSPTAKEPLPIPIEAECMARLNRLVVETEAKIVISSSWRTFARWQDLGPALVRHGLVGDVIGETPDLPNDKTWLANWEASKGTPFAFEHLERGWEIGEWLAAHPEVTAFVILDDCSDMDALVPWLVLTHPNEGLADPDVERAKWVLEHSAEGIEKANEHALGYDKVYTRSCEGYVYFGDQGIEVCETCGGCTCCDHADVDHRKARYRCLLDREGKTCLIGANSKSKLDHDCERDRYV